MPQHTPQANVPLEEQSSVLFVDRQMIGNGLRNTCFINKCKLIHQRLELNQCLLQDPSQVPEIQPPQPQPEEKQVEEQSSSLGMW